MARPNSPKVKETVRGDGTTKFSTRLMVEGEHVTLDLGDERDGATPLSAARKLKDVLEDIRLGRCMELSRATLSETVATDSNGLHIHLSTAQLAQAGVGPGQPAVVEVRPYTTQDWERDNAGRIYESTAEMDAALDEYRALPDAGSH